MRKRRNPDPDDAWIPVAPDLKVEEEEEGTREDGPTYEDNWYQVLSRSLDEETAAPSPE